MSNDAQGLLSDCLRMTSVLKEGRLERVVLTGKQ